MSDQMTVIEFLRAVNCGLLIDDDGFGEALDKDKNILKKISPSGCVEIPNDAVWINWYNK